VAAIERLLEISDELSSRVVICAAPVDRPLLERVVEETARGSVRFISDSDYHPDRLLDALRAAVSEFKNGRSNRRASGILFYCEVSSLLSSARSGADALAIAEGVVTVQRECGALAVTAVHPASVPNGVDSSFAELHDLWTTDPAQIGRHPSEYSVNASLGALVLDDARGRLALLHRMRESDPGVVHLSDSYRRGFIVVDRELRIRFATRQMDDLLGRSADELVSHPLSICLDGVDLATVRREIVRVEHTGESSPFITSWRLGGGRYEPREITVDPMRQGGRTIGYLLSLGINETVRGPRTVYRDTREELSLTDFVVDDEEIQLDDAINGKESSQITRREHDVLLFVLQGKANKEIAQHLDIAEVTVKKHLTSVYRKLRITNRKELLQSFSVPQSDSEEEG
jgi:DNA-binding CsgD family transcriptional regulator